MKQATFGNLKDRQAAFESAWELGLFARPEGDDGLTVCGPAPKIAALRVALDVPAPPEEEDKNSSENS